MTSVLEIESWVRSGESENIEFKRTTGERREAVRTVCAMLNHRGGRVIFGVEPDGRVLGQMVSDRTVEEVAQELGEIEPPVFPSIERVDWAEGRQLLVIAVQTGSAQPYTYRGQAYRRVGNTSRHLSREEYNRILLERLHGDERWENRPATGWSVADLDTEEILRTLEESIRRGRADDPGTRDPAEVLRGLGLGWAGPSSCRRGIIEAWGRGTIKMEELTVRAGLARPEILEQGGCVTVRFAPSSYVPPQRVAQDVTERQQRVLAFLAGHPSGAPVRDIAAGLGYSGTPRSVREDLTTLKHLGLVTGEGWGRGARWRLA
jgi:predicted HTH transcriptional regulator